MYKTKKNLKKKLDQKKADCFLRSHEIMAKDEALKISGLSLFLIRFVLQIN